MGSAATSGVGAMSFDEYVRAEPTSDAFNQSASADRSTGAPTGVLNLTEDQTAISGASPNDSTGWSVTSAGDVDGDGVTDLLVGAPTQGDDSAGAAHLFYGPITAENLSLAEADVTFHGEAAGDGAGWSVGGGDIDGDGYSDIVIGAPYNDEGGTDAGAAYVLFGGESMRGTVSLDRAHAKLVGDANGSLAGFDVDARTTNVSDAPGLIVGAPSSTEGRGAGAAYLITADSLSETTQLSTENGSRWSNDAKFVGEESGDRAGWSVAWAGDVDDDGTVEATIGAPHVNRSDAPRAGATYVVGADAAGPATLSDAIAKVVGANPYDNAGFDAAGAGDVNGDGIDDLLLGAPSNDGTGQNAGAAYIVYGTPSLDGTRNVTDSNVMVYGERPGDRLGWSVDGARDIDCDGYDDVVVGAPYHGETGTTYVVYGRSSDVPPESAKLLGRAVGDFAGASVGGISGEGDASGIIVGAPGSDVGGFDSGAVYLVEGGCEATSAASEGVDLQTSAADDHEDSSEQTAVESSVNGDAQSHERQAGDDGAGDSVVESSVDRGPGQDRQQYGNDSRGPEDDSKRSADRPGDSAGDREEPDDEQPPRGESPSDGRDSRDGGGDPGEGDPPSDGRDPENGNDEASSDQYQSQQLHIYQNQCQSQAKTSEQHQTQEQGVEGAQTQSQSNGGTYLWMQYQYIDVVQNQCQYQDDGHDSAQQQRQVLRIVFKQQQDAGEDRQDQSQTFDSDQNQTQNQTGNGQVQTQMQVFEITFIQEQQGQATDGSQSQHQGQEINVEQNQDQDQGDGYNLTQTQFQTVQIVYQGQNQTQTYGGDQSQAQEQSVEASQRQHQVQTNESENQTQNESVELEQNQNQAQQGEELNQTQNQSASVDQSQNQSQPNQTQNQSQSVSADQDGDQLGGENQTQGQNQSAELNQSQTQNQTLTNASESQDSGVEVTQNQTQNQTGGNNTQSQNESVSIDQNQDQDQNDANWTTTTRTDADTTMEGTSETGSTTTEATDLQTNTKRSSVSSSTETTTASPTTDDSAEAKTDESTTEDQSSQGTDESAGAETDESTTEESTPETEETEESTESENEGTTEVTTTAAK